MMDGVIPDPSRVAKKQRPASDDKESGGPDSQQATESEKPALLVANLLPPILKTDALPLEIHLPGEAQKESAPEQNGANTLVAAATATAAPLPEVKPRITLLPLLNTSDRQTPVKELAFAARLVEQLTVPEPPEGALPTTKEPAAEPPAKSAVPADDALAQTDPWVKPAVEFKAASAGNQQSETNTIAGKAASGTTEANVMPGKRQESADSGREQSSDGKEHPGPIQHSEISSSGFSSAARYSDAATAPVASSAREFASGASTKVVIHERAVDLAQPEPQAERASGPARDVSVRLSNDKQESVDLRVVERNGELHVAVRAADAGLSNALRNNLSELSGRLDHSGFQTEMWTPASAESSLADPKSKQGSDGKDHAPGHGSGGNAGESREQKQRDQHQPRWVEELENSFGNRRKP